MIKDRKPKIRSDQPPAIEDTAIEDIVFGIVHSSASDPGPHLDQQTLEAYYADRLSDEETGDVREHLVSCRTCARNALAAYPGPWKRFVRAWRLSWLGKALQYLFEKPVRVAFVSACLLLFLATGWFLEHRRNARLEGLQLNVDVVTLEASEFFSSARADELRVASPGTILILWPSKDLPEDARTARIKDQKERVLWRAEGLVPAPDGTFSVRLPQALDVPQEVTLEILNAGGEVVESFVVFVVADAQPTGNFRLSPDDPARELALAGGETNSHYLELEADSFLHLTIEQKGIDVGIQVIAPSGERLFQVDSPTGDSGNEEIFLHATEGNLYRFDVRALAQQAKPGHYRVTIHRLRPASSDDRRLAAAEQAYAEAYIIEQANRGAIPQEALKLYHWAAQRFEQIDKSHRAAAAFYRLAKMNFEAKRPKQALKQLEEALKRIGETTEDRRLHGLILSDLGHAHQNLGDLASAEKYLAAALDNYGAAGFEGDRATTMIHLGRVHQRRGDLREALELFHRAQPILKSRGPSRAFRYALKATGDLYTLLGEGQLALDFHHRARRLVERDREPNAWADLRLLEGNAWLGIADSSVNPSKRAQSFEEAKAAYREVWELDAQLGQDRAVTSRRGAVAMVGLAMVHDKAGELEEAKEKLERALRFFESRQASEEILIVQNNLGWLHTRTEEIDLALAIHREARKVAEETHHLRSEARALLGLARAESARGALQIATDYAKQALAIIETTHDRSPRGASSIAYLESKYTYFEFLIELLMEQERQNPSCGFAESAVGVSERARAQGLLVSLNETRSDLMGEVDPTLVDTHRRLSQEIQNSTEERSKLKVELAQSQQSVRMSMRAKQQFRQMIDRVERRLRFQLAELERIEGALRTIHPLYPETTGPEALTAARLQAKLLDPDTLLLIFHLGEPRSYLWVLDQASLNSFTLVGRRELETRVTSARRLIAGSHRLEEQLASQKALRELSRLLLKPASAMLDAKRLLIIPSGSLHLLPFAALPDPTVSPDGSERSPLIERFELITSPSASVLVGLQNRRAQRPTAEKLLAVVGDPVFSAEDPRLHGRAEPSPPWNGLLARESPPLLPMAGEEALAILNLAKNNDPMAALGFDATRERVLLGKLRDYQFLHFVAHGEADSSRLDLSSILLSRFDRRGRSIAGTLSARDLLGLELQADLVVLSACETSVGRVTRTEGVQNLTRSLFNAGASGAVVSLWRTHGRATATLMEAFYRFLLVDNLSPAAALRQAQISIRRRPEWRAPSHWAAFSFQGLDVPVERHTRNVNSQPKGE